jgi:hypothetical protein
MADITREYIASTSPDVMKSKQGRLIKGTDGTLTAYVGTDPDAQVNVFHYDEALIVKYTITKELYNTESPCHQGPIHDGTYKLTGIKYEHGGWWFKGWETMDLLGLKVGPKVTKVDSNFY